MTQVLFIQGAGKGTHDEWDHKLADSLQRELGDGFEVRYPHMPNEDDPNYPLWKAAIMGEIASLQSGLIVVGHSIGGTMLVNALAESVPSIQLGAIVLLAAPFIGKEGWPSDDIQLDLDFGSALPADIPVLLYHGTRDKEVPVAHVELYAKSIPHARIRTLDNRDHQLGNNLSEVAADIRNFALKLK